MKNNDVVLITNDLREIYISNKTDNDFEWEQNFKQILNNM